MSLPLVEEAHFWGATAADAVCRARGDAGAVFRLNTPARALVQTDAQEEPRSRDADALSFFVLL